MNNASSNAAEAGKASILGLLSLFFFLAFGIVLIVPDPLPVIDELVLLTLAVVSGNGSYKSVQNMSVDEYGQLEN